MQEQFQRIEFLIGKESLNILKEKHVAIFGIGGVGGFVCEALSRCGIYNFTLVDNDIVDITNLNRQIIALHSTIGKEKVIVMKDRILDINPDAKIEMKNVFVTPDNIDDFDWNGFDYVVDAIDNITAKIKIIEKANENNIPIISSMGTGNKLNPTKIMVTDIYKTKICPLARVMRRELKKRDIKSLKVVYSEETPIKPDYGSILNKEENKVKDKDEIADNCEKGKRKKAIPGSTSFVPSVAGLIIASEVIRDLIKKN